jgi:hypothetical protein
MDEVLPDGGGGSFTPPIPLDEFERELDEGARFVINAVKKELLYPILNSVIDDVSSVTSDQNGRSGVITLPNDYERFVSLKMDDWTRPVTELIGIDSDDYKMQFNLATRGTPWKPVAVLVAENTIEYYTSESITHKIKELKYVPTTLAEDMPENLIDGMTWFIASRILAILGHQTQEADKNAKEALGIIKIGLKDE